MAYLQNREYRKANSLTEVWSKISDDDKKTLDIKNGTTVVLTAKKQFENYYRNRTLLAVSSEDSVDRFLMIWHDNIFILEKLKLLDKIISGLVKFDNWGIIERTTTLQKGVSLSTSEEIGDSKGIGFNNSDSRNDSRHNKNLSNFSLQNSGSTDSNSNFGEAQKGIFTEDVAGKIANISKDKTTANMNVELPSDQMSQSKNLSMVGDYIDSDGKQGHTGISLNSGTSKVSSSSYGMNMGDGSNVRVINNHISEHKLFLNIQIPALRKEFWNKFSVLFY